MILGDITFGSKTYKIVFAEPIEVFAPLASHLTGVLSFTIEAPYEFAPDLDAIEEAREGKSLAKERKRRKLAEAVRCRQKHPYRNPNYKQKHSRSNHRFYIDLVRLATDNASVDE
jgi:hypothetical protein